MPALLNDGYPDRLSGQDSGRGTFFHRHAMVQDQTHRRILYSVAHFRRTSPTSLSSTPIALEEAVLAFEYGYATTDPVP